MQLDKSPITFMLPVADEPRAKRFYGEVLGLKDKGATADGRPLFGAEGSEIALYPDPKAIDTEHTALSFDVPDLLETMNDLKQQGVRFEDYDLEGLQTVEGVVTLDGERAAWFHDSEGNLLCVHETT